MHGGDPGKSVVSFELEYRFKGNQKKKKQPCFVVNLRPCNLDEIRR